MTCAGRAGDEIRTYTVPKERPAAAQPQAAADTGAAGNPAMPAADIPTSPAHVTWTTPSTWQELAPTSIRLGNFLVRGDGSAKAEVAIFSFPGSVGTELDNVNRWRNELKLAPISDDQIVSQPVTVDGTEGKLYEIPGDSAETVVVSLPRNGSTWFFKMRGDKGVVTDAEPVFRDFLKSVHFNAAQAEAPHDASLGGAVNPHGDLSGGAPAPAPADASGGGEPKFPAPANWKTAEPGPMIFKRYAVADGDKTADVTISFFPGDVGGTFANINRWRRQMSLPPAEESDLPNISQSLDTAGGKGTLVDFTGTEAKTGQTGHLVAVIVPHGDNTWFYKLLGDDAVVKAQKDAFVKFVQTVQYP